MTKRRASMRRVRAQQLSLFADEARAPTPLSRATARRGARAFEAPAPKPWHCVVLAVDTARRSGWAIALRGMLWHSGELDTLDEHALEAVVAEAAQLAVEQRVPVVLVLEAPWGGSVDVVAALGVARERWLRAWRRAQQSSARVVRVTPSSWRGPVLGSGSVGLARLLVRELEQRLAAALVGRAVGADEAPAILIARWAAHAARVGRAIGTRASKASLRAWTGGNT